MGTVCVLVPTTAFGPVWPPRPGPGSPGGAMSSWGLGTGVEVEAAESWMAPGAFGWAGGTGTSARVDPTREIAGVLLTQRAMTGPRDVPAEFWAAVAAAA